VRDTPFSHNLPYSHMARCCARYSLFFQLTTTRNRTMARSPSMPTTSFCHPQSTPLRHKTTTTKQDRMPNHDNKQPTMLVAPDPTCGFRGGKEGKSREFSHGRVRLAYDV
jgi:hypothetical protein